MKAYYAYIADDDDAGGEIIFANTAQEAKKMAYGREFTSNLESYIYLRVRRDERYDGMEKLSPAELALHQWKDGWRWLDADYPDPDEATDQEFLEWHKRLLI
jgi:hypothetical protein